MSAFEELRDTGQLGRETVALFVRLLASSAKRYGFPPPGGGAWTPAAREAWVQDFFVKKGHEVGVKLLLSADGDEDALTKVVRRAIENELKDQARATTAGKMRSRLRTLLTPSDEFLDATSLYGGDPAWTLPAHGDAVYTGDWMDLLQAPGLKKIEPIRALNTAGPTSRDNAEKLTTAVRVILETARGAVRDQVLATAIVYLFELDAPEAYLIREDDQGRSALRTIPSPEEQVEAIEAAERIILELAPDEGRVLLVLEEPIAIATAYLRHVVDVENLRESTRHKLRSLIDPVTLPPGTFDIVLDHFRRLPPPP